MKNKYYNVLLALTKNQNIELICEQHLASDKESAIALAIRSDQATKLLLDGYAIGSKTATALHETIAPINSGNDCLVVRNRDDSLSHIYIDLRTEYTDGFKQDLQAFVSKYFANIPAIYPEFKK